MRARRVLTMAAALSAFCFAPGMAGQVRFHDLFDFGSAGGFGSPIGVVVGGNSDLFVLYGDIVGGGAVYHLQPGPPGQKWTGAMIYNFTGQTGDAANVTSLAIPPGANGVIYGSSSAGGTYGYGTVFELIPPASGDAWTDVVLHSFSGMDGLFPAGIIFANGALYGVATNGGDYGQGTVFQLTQDSSGNWSEKTLYHFTGGEDGGYPTGIATDTSGVLYGTAAQGGSVGEGAVFSLTRPAAGRGAWAETVVYSFLGGEAGASPASPVIGPDGTIYGTTGSGVFALTRPSAGGAWTESTVHSFWGAVIGGPDSPIVLRDGAIYGSTSPLICICTCSGGGVYQLQQPAGAVPGSPWNATLLHRFLEDSVPYGPLVVNNKGTLLGGSAGGLDYGGFVYALEPDSAGVEDSDENVQPNSICGSPVSAIVNGWRRK